MQSRYAFGTGHFGGYDCPIRAAGMDPGCVDAFLIRSEYDLLAYEKVGQPQGTLSADDAEQAFKEAAKAVSATGDRIGNPDEFAEKVMDELGWA